MWLSPRANSRGTVREETKEERSINAELRRERRGAN